MEHFQVLKCDKCGMVYEIRWKTDETLMLTKVLCALICVKCEETTLSKGLVKYLKEATT